MCLEVCCYLLSLRITDSCNTSQITVFTLFSTLVNVLYVVFVFICRESYDTGFESDQLNSSISNFLKIIFKFYFAHTVLSYIALILL